MSVYKGKKQRVNVSATHIADKFSDLSTLGQYVDNIPKEQRDKIGELHFDRDTITLKNPAIGQLAFKIVERTPDRIGFKADGLLPLALGVNLNAVDEHTTDLVTDLDIDIPMMLRPMIGGKIQQVVDMLGEMLAKLASN